MATAPKAAPKVVPIDDNAKAATAPKKSGRKIMLIILLATLLLAGGAGGAWYFLVAKNDGSAPAAAAKPVPPQPPVFLAMEPFTVNLQAGEYGEQFLQVAVTLQVANQGQVDLIKLHMPQARSRMLMLLSSKKGSDLMSVEGKKKLQEEIIAQINIPFAEGAAPQAVSDVFFTAFVIQ